MPMDDSRRREPACDTAGSLPVIGCTALVAIPGVMFNRLHSLGFGLFILTTITACPPQEGESTSDDSTGSDTGSATDAATDAATEPTGGDDSTSTTDGATSMDATTAEPTSTPTTVDTASDTTAGDDSDSDSDSDSGGPVEVIPECQAVCGKLVECGLAPSNEGCAEDCSEEVASESAECGEALVATLACQGALTCEQILDAMEQEMNPCTELEEQVEAICSEGGEICSEGGGGGPGDCEYSRQCRGESELAMKCDDETCVCTIDGVEVHSCAADAVCDDPGVETLEAKFKACCEG